MEHIINKIEKLRKSQRYNQKQFAEMLDMTQTGYSQMVSNKDLKLSTLLKIADVLKVNIKSFFDENETIVIDSSENEKLIHPIADNINKICRIKGLTLEELSLKIGYTYNGLHKAIKINEFKTSTLYRLSEVLEVPVDYFFKRENNYKLEIENNRVVEELQNQYIKKSNLDKNIEEIKLDIKFIKELLQKKNDTKLENTKE